MPYKTKGHRRYETGRYPFDVKKLIFAALPAFPDFYLTLSLKRGLILSFSATLKFLIGSIILSYNDFFLYSSLLIPQTVSANTGEAVINKAPIITKAAIFFISFQLSFLSVILHLLHLNYCKQVYLLKSKFASRKDKILNRLIPKAEQLHMLGMSYSAIAKSLKIGRETARKACHYEIANRLKTLIGCKTILKLDTIPKVQNVHSLLLG